MRFKEISAAEALESLAEGGKQYILKELCEVTPASEMICARFVVEITEKGGKDRGEKQSSETDAKAEEADG